MTSPQLANILSCVQQITNIIGPCSKDAPRLRAHDRMPQFPEVSVDDLLLSAGERLHDRMRPRISDILAQSLMTTKKDLLLKYHQVVDSLFSQERHGWRDADVHDQLIRTFETLYRQQVARIRQTLEAALTPPARSVYDGRGGFGDHNRTILEKAYSHTSSPSAPEIDTISRLTGLEPHQVRTWFQNKRNRAAKQDRTKGSSALRTASASHVQQSAQQPHADGRRVASLPSRVKAKYAHPSNSSAGAGDRRPTRPLPRRGDRYDTTSNVNGVPLTRTLSQESQDSESTTFSWSSIPSNGGFTGFEYPSASPETEQAVGYDWNMKHLAPKLISHSTSSSTSNLPTGAGGTMIQDVHQIQQPSYPSFDTSINGFYNPYNLDLTLPMGIGVGLPTDFPTHTHDPNSGMVPGYGMDGMAVGSNTQEMNFEQYLLSTSTLDSLAPPTDDLSLSADFEVQVQAALRSTENTSFQNMSMTLAPTPSPSSSDNFFVNQFVSGSGSGSMVDSPHTEFSMNDWFSELTDDEASSMELLKVVLDDLGMSSFSPTSSSSMDKANPVEYISPVALQSGTGMDGKQGSMVGQGGRSECPETIASFALRSNGGSGRGSPLSLSQSTSPSTGSVNQYTFPHGSTAYSVHDPSTSSTSTNGLGVASGSGSGTYDSSTMDDLSTMFDIDMSSLDSLHQHQHRQSQSQSLGMARYQDGNGNGTNGHGERNMEAEGWMMGVLPFDMVDEGMVIA